LSIPENVFAEALNGFIDGKKRQICRQFHYSEVNGSVKRAEILKIKIFEILGVFRVFCKPGKETN